MRSAAYPQDSLISTTSVNFATFIGLLGGALVMTLASILGLDLGLMAETGWIASISAFLINVFIGGLAGAYLGNSIRHFLYNLTNPQAALIVPGSGDAGQRALSFVEKNNRELLDLVISVNGIVVRHNADPDRSELVAGIKAGIIVLAEKGDIGDFKLAPGKTIADLRALSGLTSVNPAPVRSRVPAETRVLVGSPPSGSFAIGGVGVMNR
jgi:hypothetical protein